MGRHFLLLLAAISVTATIVTTASAYEPAQSCDKSKCKLPNCRCASTSIPGGLPANETPQIITISYDDALRVQDYTTYYSKVFTANRTNPNGCPIGVTFFASHNYTNYALMEDLYYTNGYEMADHSVTHREPIGWWANASKGEWSEEILDQRTIEMFWGNVPEIYGFRAPFLVTTENEIEILYEKNFTYEASMPSREFYWPFTLDYKSPLCNLPATCPINSYPGLWIVPNIVYDQNTSYPCNMLDACTGPQTEEDWFNFLMDNFYDHYNGSRAPYGLYAHSSWFYRAPGRDRALMTFLDKMQELDDVYIVTHYQLIQWVRNPTPLDELGSFADWQCPQKDKPRCSYESPTCNKFYDDPGEFLVTCTSPCPPEWPTVGEPRGMSGTPQPTGNGGTHLSCTPAIILLVYALFFGLFWNIA